MMQSELPAPGSQTQNPGMGFHPQVQQVQQTSLTSLPASVASSPSSSQSPRPGTTDKATYLENFNYPWCTDINRYEKIAKIGQGTFGEVFKARDRRNRSKIVALKKVLMENEKEGFPITAVREIRILQKLKHENIVNLIEVCRTKATASNRSRAIFYLVFDFCEHDLAGLLNNIQVKFSLAEIKDVIKQMLNGLYFIHENKIIHRDMKSANILITKEGILKLADFGLARSFSLPKPNKPNRYTNRVVTLWYRPPELLLGERNYTPAIDIWGVGCIMAEMWTRSPIMQGNTEQTQLNLIAQLCGSITPEIWPGVENLDLYTKMQWTKGCRRRVKERLKPYIKDSQACDLIDKMLTLDPVQRLNADQSLDHDFFWTDPKPCSLKLNLANHGQSMFEYLAPRRGGHAQAAAAQQQQRAQRKPNEGYQDMVY